MASVSHSILAGVLPSSFPAMLTNTAARLLAFDQADQTYATLRASGQPLLESLLTHLQVRYQAAPADLRHIPSSGPTVVVSNHPFGILEAAVLVTALRQIRPDVRVLANELLRCLPELEPLLIPVDVLHGSARANARGMRQAVDFLSGGGLLIVFPAGEVSHFHWRERASVDPDWHPAVARLISLAARRSKPVTVPVFIPGSNSPAFHAAGMLHPALRTALLARELFNKQRRTVELRIGSPIAWDRLASLPDDHDRIAYLRWRTDLLQNRNAFAPETRARHTAARPVHHDAIAPPIAPELLAAEVEPLHPLDQSGDLRVYLAAAAQVPNLLHEIGRLREITFRQVGEGTARSLDLDRFDDRYLHLFVWHASRREVVGAYRLQATERTPELYTQTLFQFDQRFLTAMGPAVELGRSFIRTEYQKGFAPLLLLWKGIGKFIAQNPRYKTLFGPVSISNQYQAVSRELMIAFLEKSASLSEWMGLVRARNAPPAPRRGIRCADLDELSEVISDIEPSQAGIPVLLRQYLKLGGRLLGFNVDPEFSAVLDGLIVVDLTRTEPKLLERYLGKAEAASFLDFHKEQVHGT